MNIEEYIVTCEACPLQIEGQVFGWTFYFRARHDQWRIESPNPYADIDWDKVNLMLPGEAKERLANRRSIASGDTDDFTVGQAIDLIHNEVNKFYSAQGEMPPYMEGM